MIPTMAQATPIPALAPVESPLLLDDVVPLLFGEGGVPGARLVDVGLKPFVHVIDSPAVDGTV